MCVCSLCVLQTKLREAASSEAKQREKAATYRQEAERAQAQVRTLNLLSTPALPCHDFPDAASSRSRFLVLEALLTPMITWVCITCVCVRSYP